MDRWKCSARAATAIRPGTKITLTGKTATLSQLAAGDEFRRVALWLDCQSPELGAYTEVEAQKRGQLVWPQDDVDPQNPTAVEYGRAFDEK